MHIPTILTAASAIPAVLAGTWHSLPALPFPLQEHSATAIPNGTLYLLGGVSALGINTLPSLLSFTPSASNPTWRSHPPLPVALNHPNLIAVGHRLLVLGGLAPNATHPTNWAAQPDSYAFDLRTQHWTRLPDAPSPRGSAAIAVDKRGRVVLAGGMTLLQVIPGGEQRTVASVAVFDSRTDTWARSYPSLPEGRDHAGAAQVGQKLYVLGGRVGGKEQVRNTSFVLDLRKPGRGWRSGAEMPTARGSVAAAAVGGKVYTFGGEGNVQAESGVFGEVEVYDTVRDCWERLDAMPMAKHGMPATAVGGRVYIAGGSVVEGGAGTVADVDVFVPKMY
ncbi:hypothetical protein EDC01DRAFT_746346 [Geopyxis carbonaria]|nr:hypothetical protein EDC01DRAFT_746346 [Geopyxis carbonaria]